MELCKLSNIKVSDRLIRHKTTHLLCCISAGEDESDKLITARAWGSVRIISIGWLLQSIRTGRRAAETEYLVVKNTPGAPGRTAAAPVADTSEPSDAHRDAVTAGTSQLPAPSAADDPRPPQKPQGDEPDGMLDFVAKLTSVAKATGKRCACWCIRKKTSMRVTNASLADARPEPSWTLLPAVLPRYGQLLPSPSAQRT
jgi:hypothetical protein